MKYSIFCAAILAVLPALALAGKNEEDILKAVANEPEEAMKLALKNSSRSIATCAFSYYLVKSAKAVDDTLLNNILSMAKKGEPDHVALLVANCGTSATVKEIANGLAAKEVEGQRMAAAVYACLAMMDHEFAFRQERSGSSEPVKGASKGKGKGKGKGKRKTAAKAAAPSLPEALWTSTDTATLQMTILAAAYAKDKSVADQIQAIDPKKRGLPGAKLLYAAMTGGEITEESAKLPFMVRMQPADLIKTVSPELSRFNPRPLDPAVACEALGIAGKSEFLPHLHDALSHSDIRVRFEAARALGRIGSPDSMGPLSKALMSCEWPVVIEIADALARHPDKRVLPAMLKRLQLEKGRLRIDLQYALGSIVGEKKADTAKEWIAWYKKEGRGVEVDLEKTKAFREEYRLQDMFAEAYTYFYGIHIYSDRFIYVVDTSKSMNGSKIKSMKENLIASIKRIKRGPRYNIVDFGGDVIAMSTKGLITSTSSAAKHVAGMPLTLATRTWDALEQAAMIPDVDTLIFLSDGAPARSKIRSWSTTRKAWVLQNKYRPLSLSTIDFAPTAGNKAAMKALADENFGWNESVHVD